MRTRALWLFAAAALLVVALLGAADADAAGWLAAVLVAPPPASGTTVAPALSTDAHGDQVIVWQNLDPNGETCGGQTVASRVSGGDFVETVIPCGYQVVLSPTGIVYVYYLGAGGAVERSAPVGQPLPATDTPVGPLEGPNGDSLQAGNIQFSFDAAGNPTVVYASGDASVLPNTWEFAASTPDPDGNWTAQVISQADVIDQSLDTQVAGDGSAVVVWPYSGAIDYVRRAAGESTWTAPAAAVPAGGNEMALRPDPQDRFTLMYQSGSYPTATANAVTMSSEGVWGSEEPIPMAQGYSANYGKLAVDSHGNAVATWWEVSGGSTCCLVGAFARAAGSSSWADAGSDLADVTFSTSFKTLDLNFDPHDTPTIALKLDSGTQYFTRVAGATTFTAASAPSTPPGSTSPALSEDPQGYLTATWVDGTGALYSAVYDPVPPTIDSVTPPGAAVAGEPASFTVGGSDVWGPLSFTIDFGDGQSAQGRLLAPRSATALRARSTSTTIQHTYSQPGLYGTTVTVNDGAANTATTNRTVTVAERPAATTAPPPPLPPVLGGLPDPVLGQSANVTPVKPVVRIKAPGSRVFVALTAPAQIKIGSVIDTRKGRVRITVADGHGGLSTADFYEGLFRLTQKRTGSKLATLVLSGGSFKGCPKAPRPQLARVRSKSRSVRHLWGSGKGAFRTAGRFSAASIRGTSWKTDDRCNGTLTLVTQGKVAVRDFVKRKTIVVKARHRYFARPRQP